MALSEKTLDALDAYAWLFIREFRMVYPSVRTRSDFTGTEDQWVIQDHINRCIRRLIKNDCEHGLKPLHSSLHKFWNSYTAFTKKMVEFFDNPDHPASKEHSDETKQSFRLILPVMEEWRNKWNESRKEIIRENETGYRKFSTNQEAELSESV